MIEIKREGVLLTRTDFRFENEAVLNPAVIREGNNVHMFYRAVQQGNYSSIGYCRLEGPLTVVERWAKPIMIPEFDYDSHGIEDARIVKIDGLYYMSYTSYDGVNARGSLATSKDLLTFEKQGIIVPTMTYAAFVAMVEKAGKVNQDYYLNHHFYYEPSDPEKKMILWDKNVIFFPRRINGKLVFLHRIRPGIQIVSVKHLTDLTEEFWEDYLLNFHDHIVVDPLYAHEASYIGGGCPPIETEHGWLLIYHGVHKTDKGLIYSACAAALLDLNNPIKVIARLPYPLFKPELEYELKGDVNNVVFPTGTALFDDTLYIYYGAADSVIACASLSFSGLLTELLTNKGEPHKVQ